MEKIPDFNKKEDSASEAEEKAIKKVNLKINNVGAENNIKETDSEKNERVLRETKVFLIKGLKKDGKKADRGQSD